VLVLLYPTHPDLLEYDEKVIRYNQAKAESIARICNVLFEKLKVTTFEYCHFFDNGTCLYVSTNPEWHEHYIRDYIRQPFIKGHLQQIFNEKTRFHRWDVSPHLPKEENLAQFISDRRRFGLWHDFTLYEHHDHSLEAWSFSTSESNYALVNFYHNNLDIITRFIMYFRQEATEVITISSSDKMINVAKENLFLRSDQAEIKINGAKESIIELFPIKKYSWDIFGRQVSLTRRELECMCHLSCGLGKKEVARQMGGIKARTVDTHENNIKNKTGIYRPDLLKKTFSKSILANLCTGDKLK